uniref:Reverse transcriptase n=1 Tax=Globodera rostochiensis TaxID=31243 RepID=A0A914HES4_GLORO
MRHQQSQPNYLTRRRAHNLREEDAALNLADMQNLLEQRRLEEEREAAVQQVRPSPEGDQNLDENSIARERTQNGGANDQQRQHHFSESMEMDGILDGDQVSIASAGATELLAEEGMPPNNREEQNRQGFRQFQQIGDRARLRGAEEHQRNYAHHPPPPQFNNPLNTGRPYYETFSLNAPPYWAPPFYGMHQWGPPPWVGDQTAYRGAPAQNYQRNWQPTNANTYQNPAPNHMGGPTGSHHITGPSESQYNRLEAVLILDKLPDINGREGSDKRSVIFERIKVEMIQTLDDLDARETSAFDDLFSGLIRHHNETIDQLADRVGRTVQRAYPNLSSSAIDDLSTKHFLRALDSQDLALTLEVSRTPSMSYDQFVTLAARAEATKKAVQKTSTHSRALQNVQQAGRDNNEYRSRQAVPAVTRACYNCGKSGHIAPYCQEPRRSGQSAYRTSYNTQPQSQLQVWPRTNHPMQRDLNQNRGPSYPQQSFTPNRTGANNFPLTMGKRPNYDERGHQQNGSAGTNAANCIQVEEVPKEKVAVGSIGTNGELLKWLEELGRLNADGKESLRVGKLVVFELLVHGEKTSAMLDGGAQLSLISAGSLFKLVQEGVVDVNKRNYNSTRNTAFDFNGKKINTFGVITLPVNRADFKEVEIEFYITSAAFGFDMLIGTNTLGLLGLKMYDEKTNTMIEFECVSEKEAKTEHEVRVACNVTLQPKSITLVQLKLDEETTNDLIVTSSDEIQKNFRIEPSAVKAKDKNIVVPITNYSACAIKIPSNEIIGVAEVAENVTEVGNALDFKPIRNVQRVSNLQTREDNFVEKRNKLEEILPSLTGELGEEEKQPLLELLFSFEEIFVVEDHELTQTDLVTHYVDTEKTPPVKMRVRPVPFAFREKVATMLQDYLERGLIRPSWSPYASPIVLVPKKDGTIRFCIDYRGLNAVTVKDAFPLPNIDNTLMMLGNKKVFSTMDFMSGYWQIRMHPDSVSKTAFITEFGLYEYLVMPFGMSNAVATFQRFMTRLFDGVLNNFVFIYIDDLLRR